MKKSAQIQKAYTLAKEYYSTWGVDADQAMESLAKIPISLHCWQGDDVGGFEHSDSVLGGGLAVTGNYPGKARTAEELRMDIEKVYSLLPGKHRLNLHAIYAETGGRKVDRDEVGPEHFSGWIDWAKSQGIGVDFNPSYFAHPKAASGFTLSHADEGIRKFWVAHGIACRKIAAAFGKALGTPSVNNVWIPDGYKDTPVDRKAPRERLAKSLDEMFAVKLSSKHVLDAVEGKLFGIGTESYTTGSHEFYLGYAIKNNKLVCLDAGHYHPTETIADKISSVMAFLPEILLHVSRGVRWDSDHVVVLNDDLLGIAQEIVRGGFTGRVHIGLDYFDASINRVAAWVVGMRCMLKALLISLLEPVATQRELEASGDYTGRLVVQEEAKTLPFGAVWDYYCMKSGVAIGQAWLDEVRRYERDVLSGR
jgi:L-rhamnose isomerase